MLFVVSLLTAQTPGKFTVSAAAGVVSSFAPSKVNTDMIPLSLRIGYDISKSFNIGTYFGYTAATSNPRVFSDGLISQVQNKSFMVGLRTELNRNLTKKLNVYGGVVIGYNSFNTKEFDTRTGQTVVRDPKEPTPYNPNAPKGQVLYAGFVGTNYKVYKGIALLAEAGYGISLFNLGVNFKL
jgi:hypothetical protein